MSLVQKMISASKLDVALYESVEADTTATTQALTVVVISALAAAVGAIRSGMMAVILTLIAALVGWVIWAFLCYIIGTKMLPEPQTEADLGQLLRTTGFAQSPGILRIFGIIPVIGWLISLAASIWMLVAMVIAVRQALDYKSTGRTVVVVLIGFVVYMIGMMALMAVGMAGGAVLGGLGG